MKTIEQIEAEITAKNEEIAALKAEKERLMQGVWKDEDIVHAAHAIPHEYYARTVRTLIRHGLAFRNLHDAKLYDRIAKDALEIRGPVPVMEGDVGYYIAISEGGNIYSYGTTETFQGLKFHNYNQTNKLIDKYGDDLKIWIRGGDR